MWDALSGMLPLYASLVCALFATGVASTVIDLLWPPPEEGRDER